MAETPFKDLTATETFLKDIIEVTNHNLEASRSYYVLNVFLVGLLFAYGWSAREFLIVFCTSIVLLINIPRWWNTFKLQRTMLKYSPLLEDDTEEKKK